jgi:cell fate (sporulation/competence/biofilm development) regulator YlbF (YheA/YmcA/DUF963 family)
MENVLNHAEQLAESILDSEEFIKMRLAEQAAMRDEAATQLITDYSERRKEVENLLAASDMDHSALAEAGKRLETAQKAMDENEKIKAMREANDVFNQMMQQVNPTRKKKVAQPVPVPAKAAAAATDPPTVNRQKGQTAHARNPDDAAVSGRETETPGLHCVFPDR